ncbi:MAG: glycosyltransferase [Bacillota bacterium]
MIKIFHLITDLETGGSEMMLFKLISFMNLNDFSNVVVSMTDEGTLGNKFKDLGIPVYTLDMSRGIPSPFAMLRLLRILWEERPSVLQTWLYHADLLGLLAGKLAGVPCILWNLRCSDMDMSHYSRLSSLVMSILARLSSLPQGVIVNSMAGKRFHEGLGYRPRRWELLPNGFDIERFRPDSESRVIFRRELGLSEDALLIGLVARFDPMKDHSTFLQAAGKLVKKLSGTEIHFVLAGRGVDHQNKEIMGMVKGLNIESNVHLLGERTDISFITAAFDIASSSSYTEGFPNVIGEAMACGVPCVVTDAGDSGILVGDTGKVVPPKDPLALAEALEELVMIGAEGRKALGLAARHRIVDNYSLPAIVSKYEELYRELAQHVRSDRLS